MVGKLGVIWLLVGESCWLVERINIRDSYNLQIIDISWQYKYLSWYRIFEELK